MKSSKKFLGFLNSVTKVMLERNLSLNFVSKILISCAGIFLLRYAGLLIVQFHVKLCLVLALKIYSLKFAHFLVTFSIQFIGFLILGFQFNNCFITISKFVTRKLLDFLL